MYTREGFLPPEAEADYKERMGRESRPVIGVIVHDHYAKTGDLAHVNALMAAIEARGCVPYAVADSFASNEEAQTGLTCRMERAYRREDGTPIPDALVVTYGFSITTLSGRAYQAGRPPHSAFEKWGLPVIQALTTYFSWEEYRRDIRGLDLVSLPVCVYQPEFDGQLISVPIAVTQRDESGRKTLQPLPDRVERVAEMACRWAALRRKPMSEKKIAVIFHNMPPRNDAIGSAHGLDTPESVYRVVGELEKRGLRLEHSFAGGAEIIGAVREAVTNDSRWLPPDGMLERAAAVVDGALYKRWFDRLNRETREQMEKSWGPAPGDVMTSGGKIAIPGILNGNLFIGLQPLRSAPEQAEALYHSTDSTPPHSYLAFYRWVDEVFGADAVIHVGTHGTLEWLPGKEVGLSSGCFGDICIGGVPHLYLYIIDIPGEGMQAKRRSYACIIDHLIPSMDESDAYGGLKDLDEAIGQYHHARQARPAQLPALAERIFSLAEELELTRDLDTDREALEADPEAGVARLHEWVSRIKTSLTRDGFHIFGQVPEGERLDQLARALVRVPNGQAPALSDAILTAQGFDPEAVRAAGGELLSQGRIGQTLADQAIAAYQAEKGGGWPESVALVVYSDACMKTHGEDVAEAFALMGVRPVYLGQSDKVVGVEPIPLAGLGRPRIDVVLRISGLFRDTFPNVVELVDRAVLCAASLEESPEDNFIKKHTDQEMARLVTEGLDENQAADQAALRVFGCPPGSYGAGVSKAIHSRNWESWEDLAQVYALWSAHGYSRKLHGQAMPELFRSRLSTVGVTVKNRSDVEIDMLDSDDFYSYHGGLMACVRAASGEKPVSLAGLTADPDRPETSTVRRELARVMRSRVLNPKWLAGLKRHGYKGAQEISTTFDTLFGWDASAEIAEQWMYDGMARQFLLDEDTRRWMEEVNDAAVHQLSERLLEAHQRGMWQADGDVLQAVRRIYMDMEGAMEAAFQSDG